MKKFSYNTFKFFLGLGIVFFLNSTSRADSTLTYTTYYPSPAGEYDTFRLIPRANLAGVCTIGSLYVKSDGVLQYCRNNGGTGAWGPLTEVWTQNTNDIYLTDIASDPQLRVGIGTATPSFKLSLLTDAGLMAKGTFGSGTLLPSLGAGTRLIWYPRKAAFRAGYISGSLSDTQWDDPNIGNYSVALGKDSTASGLFSAVIGGDTNTASGSHSVVGGGKNNVANGDYSAIGGGLDNAAAGLYSVVWGGEQNDATGDYSAILGGLANQATAAYTVIAGGSQNSAQTPYSNINGGFGNAIDYIGGGVVEGYSVIGGGKNNKARSNYTVVSGGENNTALAPYSSVGGGLNNTAGLNTAGVITGDYARVSGGEGNTASGLYSVVIGGRSNTASGDYSAIAGGWQNLASGAYSAIGGGERNTASGAYAMIMGGADNIAAGDYSWAEGKNIRIDAAADRTFAWGYSDTPSPWITAADSFIIAPGTIGANPWNPKVGIRDVTPTGVLEVNANGTADNFLALGKAAAGDVFIVKNNGYIGVSKFTPTLSTHAMQFGNANNAYVNNIGQWVNGSSRMVKEFIVDLTSQDANQAFEKLNPVSFNYTTDPQQNRIGFIAEDVPDLVALKDRQLLSSMDMIAVLTKVVQEQEKEIQDRENKINSFQARIKKLKKRVSRE